MINPHRYCVIMCGGIGSRFWPYSRTNLPKQFIDFLGTGRTLLQMSYDRVTAFIRPENIIVVTNELYAALVKEQLPELTDAQILCEPARRNTAPCIAWAAYHIKAIDPEASIIVTPSDHLITRESIFVESIIRGFEFVETNDALLTLGITPTRPETGYGYIQIGAQAGEGINEVKTFTEKPDIELARVFLSSGEFFWNSGIFLWHLSSIIKAIREYMPDVARAFETSTAMGTADEDRFIKETFPAFSAISIDFAVMEKAPNVFVECVSFGWNDLGTWSALYDNSPRNRDANVAQNCNLISYNSTGNILAVRNPDKLVVIDGLHDYIIADAGDVLLICPKAEEQRIKQMVNDTKLAHGDKYL
ncbi:MAG: mannose-1-phosphate guanylyltransferase [Muribaculaceae bacterium]|nr:mannose-1-phosphate guanylyltransferase [Muribaculaceae bacterium]